MSLNAKNIWTEQARKKFLHSGIDFLDPDNPLQKEFVQSIFYGNADFLLGDKNQGLSSFKKFA